MQPAIYLNPFTDFGFKKLFGEEYNKDLLIDFLNQLLKNEQGRIKTLTYLKNEHLGRSEADRRAVYDLYCENEQGEKFIVEIQKSKQKFFKDRALYYSTFPIAEQGKAGDWDFELKAVYTVAILDFVFDEDRCDAEKYRYDVKLTDIETYKVFYDKLTFVYLEMPKFEKTLEELETRFDKWLYVLKNLERLHDIPEKLKDRIFRKLFAAAEIAKFTPEEARAYEDSLKVYRDLKNSIDTAREEGREEGIAQVAKNLLQMGQSIEDVSKATGLSREALDKLQASDGNSVKEPVAPYKTTRKPKHPSVRFKK
ncbi:MAG TPA: Rpn family recombination-promoting nuclease/putative transposase [Candidatus Rifleibacterium sp.]|nr:Rpn family recombination-promoting nuclease/putative transposase [Candidatus Rifleibacterium sp.]